MANVKVLNATKQPMVMSAGALDAEFESFWAIYPRRIAKIAARKAYEKARALATSGDILAGVERYIRHKPSYCDFAHASSWLSAGRWADEYEAQSVPRHVRDAFVPDQAHRDLHERRAQEARQKAHSAWVAMSAGDQERLREQVRQRLRARFPYVELTADMVEAACVLELERA